MKKTFKWIALSLAILVFLIIIAASIIVWVVFTPEKLTPIVRKQAAKYLTCKTEIGNVELTFFSTFPLFGLKLTDVTLVNHLAGASSDTLLDAQEINAIVDVKAWWKHDELVLNEFRLYEAQLNAFIDTSGNTNFNITKTDSSKKTESDTSSLMPLDLNNIDLHNVSLSYIDLQSKIQTFIKNLDSEISGTLLNDSLETRFAINHAVVTFSYADELYLKDAAITCELPLSVNLAKQKIELKESWVAINDLQINVSGTIENDTLHKKLKTNLQYQINSWHIDQVLALVPLSFQKYLKGIELHGVLSSKGAISGAYSDSEMPWLDLGIQFQNGSLHYDSFPLPLTSINADIVLHSDLKNNANSYFDVLGFSARTPQSLISTKGRIRNLFSDAFIDFTTKAQLLLEEFEPFIPDSLKLKMKGSLDANLKTSFSLSQAQKMLIDKMKLSGTIDATGLDVVFDTISVSSGKVKLDFSIPNPRDQQLQTASILASVKSEVLSVKMNNQLSSGFRNINLEVATSNFMDTTKMPNVWSKFSFDQILVNSDSFGVAINYPSGELLMIPQANSKALPDIKIEYKSNVVDSWAFKNKFAIHSICLQADVKQELSQKDALLQWKANGKLELNRGAISLASIPDQIVINSLKLGFNPETFSIKEGYFKFKDSDFNLSGTLSNISSYLKKDSLLHGDFNFESDHTDILQLMVATNGLGDSSLNDTVKIKKNVNANEVSEATGPYFVPKGVDFVLHANVKKASLGYDTISNIKGDVRIKNGILVLDNLKLTTPAAKIQLTSMYRTPRKNHLYLGLDYHMFDVEIGNLMNMIPHIDSMMPMLKDFKGKAEFHFAAETYLDSMYNLKMSTIRAASSIRGQDLVLMDGPTFTELSKLLRFNKKTENKIDSLAVEFTVFKNEIDIYPFLIGIDKYKAVISGRHNMDMTFDYHVSLVESPLPIKLGANISGDLDHLKYSLEPPKYAISYRPTARNVVKDKQLQLRNLIREALLKNVNNAARETKVP